MQALKVLFIEGIGESVKVIEKVSENVSVKTKDTNKTARNTSRFQRNLRPKSLLRTNSVNTKLGRDRSQMAIHKLKR